MDSDDEIAIEGLEDLIRAIEAATAELRKIRVALQFRFGIKVE